MKKTIIQKKLKGYFLVLLTTIPTFVFSQTTVTPNTSAITLAQTIVGSGVTVTAANFNRCGGVPTGSVVSAGTFTNTSGDLGISNGIVLTTGYAVDAALSYSVLASKDMGYTYTDPDLVTISDSAIHDVCSLSFTFTPICNALNITFVFASEEWPKYICGTGTHAYNDAFGIFLSGPNPGGGNYVAKNIAVLPNAASTPVQIDSINDNYNNLCGKPENVSYFVNNGGAAGHHYSDIVYDGFTVPVTSVTSVKPCSTYVMEIAIGEATNGKYDSGVFIEGSSVDCAAPPAITATTTPNNCGSNNGTATVIGYPASSTFSWTPGGQTTSTITGLTTGNYTCTVGIPGCVTPTYTTVVATVTSSGATPVLSISGTKTICSGNSTTLTGATATNYTWMPGNITTNTISVSPTTNTTYTLIGANGACTASVVATVTVNSNPTIILNNDSICANVATGTLSASGANTYTWSTGAQTTSITAAAGTYTVTGTDANGCKNMASASIVSVSLPTITTNVNSICIGVTSTLTASGGAANSYTWSPGGPNGNSTYIVTPASTTPIVVTGANSHGCLNTHTVTVNTTPTITVNDPTTCSGQSVTIQANPSTLSSYTWTGVSSSSSTASVAPNSTTSYTVLATDANGCVSNAAISTVSVTAATQISVASSNNPPCIGSTYTLTANGATTYTWIPSTGTFTSLDANSTQISVTQGTAAVTFSVSGVGSCPATPTVITINPAPVNSLTITTTPSNAVVCNGNSATFTASGASTYTWTPNITNGVAFTPASSQVYSVTGTDVNGCMGFDTVSVVVNPNPVLTVASQTICPTATTTLTAMPTTLTSYTWSTGSFADTTIVSPSVNSVYNVSATDANGCVGTTTASINIVNNLTVTALTTNSLPCLNSLDTLTASGAQSYTWTASNGNTTSISANNSTVTINPTTTTTYTVKGSSGTCLDSATVTVNIAPPLNITVTSNPANAIICAGDNITLSGNGASTYTWTGGITDNTPFNPSISQTYTVTGTDANGCTGTANQAVTVNPTPTVTINASSPAICVGQSATLTASGANTYTWSTTEMTPSITVSPIATQTYSVIGTSTNSCTNSNAPATVTITVNPLPTISIASNPVGSAVCFGSTATLTASGAQTYTWDSGSNTNPYSISPAVQTTYTVIGTDANSCSSFTTITIGVNPLPVAQTITASSPIVCKGAINPPVVLSVPNPGTWIGPAPSTATISANSTSISITQGGVYTLITSNSCGSAASAPYTAIADSVIANFTASPLVGQMPVTVNYTNTSVALSGNTIITNSWSFGDGNTSISVNPTEIFTNAGTYQTTLTVTDNLGCKDTATIYVVVNVVPPVIVIPNIFTPNGDGLNDIFSIDATGINNFDCKVYDRWGLLLHEWQGTSGGWDGKARNGNNCTDGTYFYIITYTDNYNKSSIKDGFFELIR